MDELSETIRFRLAGALKQRVERLIARTGAGENKSVLIRRALVQYLNREEAKLADNAGPGDEPPPPRGMKPKPNHLK